LKTAAAPGSFAPVPVSPRPEFVEFTNWLTATIDEALLPLATDPTERRKLKRLRQIASGDFSKPGPSWLARPDQSDRIGLAGTACAP
jgi:hypothetical protein